MPVITLYADRFSSFVGRPLTAEEMVKWLPWLGVDIEETGPDYVKVEFNPNRIDLSSYAGVARAFCGLRGWETGLPRYEVREGDIVLRVDPRVSRVRPYVVAAVVRNLSLDDEAVKELMEMQEDIHWGVGRDRRKVSIGVHNLDAVQPPFTYTAAEPDAVRFIPLDKTEEMSPREVLERHEKGVAYRHHQRRADAGEPPHEEPVHRRDRPRLQGRQLGPEHPGHGPLGHGRSPGGRPGRVPRPRRGLPRPEPAADEAEG